MHRMQFPKQTIDRLRESERIQSQHPVVDVNHARWRFLTRNEREALYLAARNSIDVRHAISEFVDGHSSQEQMRRLARALLHRG